MYNRGGGSANAFTLEQVIQYYEAALKKNVPWTQRYAKGPTALISS